MPHEPDRAGTQHFAHASAHAELYSILDEICRDIELTQAQLAAARTSYEAVAEWLSGSPTPLLRDIRAYAHGSAAPGTTVKPLSREEFDVDLICLVLGFTADRPPTELKRLIGDRLREHARYASMLEEKVGAARECQEPPIPAGSCRGRWVLTGSQLACRNSPVRCAWPGHWTARR